jgi:hypothetical protein
MGGAISCQAGFSLGPGINFASFLRFWAVAARRNSSRAPFGPRSRGRSSLRMRLRCANSISIFLRIRREVRPALDLELQEGTVIADRVGETPCVFLAGLHRAERTIAERLMRLRNGRLPWSWIDPGKALPSCSPAVCLNERRYSSRHHPCSRYWQVTRRSDPHQSHDALGKYFFRLSMALRNALLVGVAQELLNGRPVFLDAVRKRIALEQVLHLACIGR